MWGNAKDGIAAAHGPKAAALFGRNVSTWSALGLTASIKSERKNIDQIPFFLVCVWDKKPNYYLIDSIDSVSSYIPCLLKC